MFSPGAVLSDRFRLDGAPIGAGATCEVWPATELATGCAVVVKVLHRALAEPSDVGAAVNRAALAVGVSGPAGVACLGVFGGDGRWWTVAERVDGPWLEHAGPLSPLEALALTLRIAEEVARYHRRGLVHGAVRPSRVVLAEGGARLGESSFGLALRPGHAAPEVLGGGPLTRSNDVYGLGLVLVRALTGKAPYPGNTPFAVVEAQRTASPRLPRGPLGLALLATRLLSPDPGQRPPDAATVVAALRQLQRNPERPARFSSPWFPAIRPSGPWAVHGIDPATAAPALLATGLRRRAARQLEASLRDEGWSAAAVRIAWGWRDLGSIGVAVVLGAVLLSVPGAIAGLIGAWAWRLDGVRADLAAVLPPLSIPLPARVSAPGAEEAVTAGVLLLGAAVALSFAPWLSAGMILAVFALAIWTLQRPLPEPDADLSRARLEMILVDTRRLLESRPHLLDDALGLEGEVWALRRASERGEIALEHAIARAESLRLRARRVGPLA